MEESMTPDELKKVRKNLRMTQAELAAELEVTVPTVHRWEAGVVPISRVVELALEALQARKASTSGKRKR